MASPNQFSTDALGFFSNLREHLISNAENVDMSPCVGTGERSTANTLMHQSVCRQTEMGCDGWKCSL